MVGKRFAKFLGITLVILLLVTGLVTACTSPSSTTTTTKAAPTSSAAPSVSTTAPAPTSTTVAPSTTPVATTAATTTAAPAAGAPVKGGTVKVSFTRPPVNFGYPPGITGPDQNYSRPFFEKLLRLDDNFVYKPELATSWDVAADGKSITFKLRQGVKFHDGTDFNADAVKSNYDPLLPPKSPILTGVSSIDKVDAYTVKFNLPSYNNLILFSLAADARCGIASPDALAKNGADGSRTLPVGTGPFKLKSFERNTSVTYSKNTNYWNKDLPYIDELQLIGIPDPMTQLASFKAGDINVIYDASITIADQLVKEGYQYINSPGTTQCYCFDVNHTDSYFANQKVREAIEYAVDKEAIMKGPMHGFYKAAYQTIIQGSPAYNPDLQPRLYDPVKAKQLLTEAGYPNGFSFKYIINETENQDPPTMVQSYLAKVGLTMEIVKMAPAAFESSVRVGGTLPKNTAAHMVLDYRAEPLFILNTYLRSNSPYYQNTVRPAGIDALLDQALAARDDASKNKLIQQISKLVFDNASYIPMQVQPRLVIIDKKVNNIGFCKSGDCNNGYVGYETWLTK